MKNIFALLVLLSTSTVFAQAPNRQSSEPSSVTESSESTKLTQSQRRSAMRFLIVAQPVGLAYINEIDSVVGASVGYFVNPDLIAALDVSFGNSIYAGDYSEHDSFSSFGVNAKYFLAGSFYAKGGLAYRKVSGYQYGSYSAINSDGSRLRYTTDAKLAVATLAIGNHWQIHHFVIGCDWVSANLPLATEQTSKGGPKVDGTSLEFVKFYLGASF